MNAWRRWREIRGRFFILLAFTLLAAAMVAARTPDFVAQQLAGHDAAWQTQHRLHRIDSEWFGNKGPSVMILLGAIFFAVGGPATDPARGSTLFTVALPVTRRRLVLTQFGMSVLLVALLALGGAAAAVAGGWTVGVSYPALAAIAGAFVQVAGVVSFAAVSMALQTVTRRPIVATIALFAVGIVGPAMFADMLPAGATRDLMERIDFPPMLSIGANVDVHTLAPTALLAAIPWPFIAAHLFVAAVAITIAVAVFDRTEL